MEEKRKIKRWPVFIDAHFRKEEDGSFLECLLCDLSFWGARISTQEKLSSGALIELHINLLDPLHPLIVKAKVLWMRPRQRLSYEYGLSFLELGQKERTKIYDYIYKNYPKEFTKTMLKNGKIEGRGGEEKMFGQVQPHEDRRIFARIPVDLYARYIDNSTYKEGYLHVYDISAKGMGVTTKEKFKPHTKVELWVSIPSHNTPVYTRGEIIWEKPDEKTKGFRAGISLEKADFMGYPRLIKS